MPNESFIRVRVEVREQHLKDGKPALVGLCPVALALAELVIVRPLVYNGRAHFRATTGGPAIRIALPRPVARWITRYDYQALFNEPVDKPFWFALHLPPDLLKTVTGTVAASTCSPRKGNHD